MPAPANVELHRRRRESPVTDEPVPEGADQLVCRRDRWVLHLLWYGAHRPQVAEQRLSGTRRREPAATSAPPGEELLEDRRREIARSETSLEQPPAEVREQMRVEFHRTFRIVLQSHRLGEPIPIGLQGTNDVHR